MWKELLLFVCVVTAAPAAHKQPTFADPTAEEVSGKNVTATTLPPPGPTVAPPSCADPFRPAYSGEGVNFGRHGNSFISYSLSPDGMRQYFSNSFVLKCQFRAVAPDGILVYAENPTKQNYLALYMSGGYLNVDMKTLQPDNGAYHNLKVRTQLSDYADGRWWEVNIMRDNNFLAMIVPERGDYNNNGQKYNVMTSFDLNSPLYVGGIDTRIGSGHFPIPIDTGFTGCIRLLEISAPPQKSTFYLRSPDDQYNVERCYEAIHLGTTFQGTGYATMEGSYVFLPGLDVSVRFSTVQRSFLLLLLFQDAANYFLMDAEDGRIRVHLRKNNVTTTIRTTHVETGYEVCDGEFHTVVFSFNHVGVLFLSILELDDLPANQFQQTGFNLIYGELHVGGVPAAVSLASPDLTQTPFWGCLESLAINGVTRHFRQTDLTEHITPGCPARP